MLTLQHYFTMKNFHALKLRGMIFLFLYLALAFSRMFIFASSQTHPEFAVWGNVFFDATVIIIFNVLYGNSLVGRDANTLNFYALIFHVIYLPFYYGGYQVAIYHNTAIKVINALIVLRLCYFGERELLASIAIIERLKRVFYQHRWLFSTYVNGLTITLFFLCALPLFSLIYIINTDEMRITGIAVVLFTFFIAIEFSEHRKNQSAAAPAPALSEAEKTELVQVKESRNIYLSLVKGLCLFIIVGWFFAGLVMRAKEAQFFTRGYANGYTDGKAGKAPISKEHTEKLLECYRYDPNAFRAEPQNPECEKIDRADWK